MRNDPPISRGSFGYIYVRGALREVGGVFIAQGLYVPHMKNIFASFFVKIVVIYI